MKKSLLLFILSWSSCMFSQGDLYIYNFSDHNLHGHINAEPKDPTACYPALQSELFDIPPGASKYYSGFTGAYPDIDEWYYMSSPTVSSTLTMPGATGILNILGALTHWTYCAFEATKPGEACSFSVGISACNTPIPSSMASVPTGDIYASWFVLSGITYLIVN